jgi:hypothetical protein
MDQNQPQRYEQARARAKQLKDFYTHAAVYVVVNIGLFVINFLGHGEWWFYWVLIGWGIGLGVHALNVFVFGYRSQTTKLPELSFRALLTNTSRELRFERGSLDRSQRHTST